MQRSLFVIAPLDYPPNQPRARGYCRREWLCAGQHRTMSTGTMLILCGSRLLWLRSSCPTIWSEPSRPGSTPSAAAAIARRPRRPTARRSKLSLHLAVRWRGPRRRRARSPLQLRCGQGGARLEQNALAASQRPRTISASRCSRLRKALAQVAHGATRQKESYFQALYLRLAGRRGRNRALVAVAHALVVAIYHMLTRQEPYRSPDANYFDERKRNSGFQTKYKRSHVLL